VASKGVKKKRGRKIVSKRESKPARPLSLRKTGRRNRRRGN
jgi:hypothetical protein